MIRSAIGLGLLVCASAAGAQSTDFGVRTVGGDRATVTVDVHPRADARESISEVTWTPTKSSTSVRPMTSRASGGIASAARIAAQWGRVTSTYRSPAHNRRVGGVANSYHLHGRAIDIARRPGVSHWQIAAAYRNAGYRLIESLDEGDHSHFAFSFGGSGPARRAVPSKPAQQEVTNWGVITVASAIMH